jgi:NADH-quinone oxidoreductase subunit K
MPSKPRPESSISWSRSAVPSAAPRPPTAKVGGERVAIGWYLVVSVIIFCIGVGGVLTRRNPLVVLLCLELMLNAANLALVAFARMHGGEAGQVFALIVMVVAACEVTVGLGLIVAIYRRRLPIDVDELSELNG